MTLNFSFAPGFSEHTIHVRGSLAAATVDFERNTYLLHRHTPAGLDFDRYRMTVSEAKALKRQAFRTLARTIYSKLRPIGGGPYGQSIARAMQSFYANPGESLDSRLCPELGRDVVRLVWRSASRWMMLRRSGRILARTAQYRETNGTAASPIGGPPRGSGSRCHRIYRPGVGSAAPCQRDIPSGCWSATPAGCPLI